MSVRAGTPDRWQRRSLVGLCCLVALAPAFAWAADRTGYAEPMDNAIELAGTSSEVAPATLGVFSGYAIGSLGPYAGTLGGALVGTLLTLGLALGVGRLLAAGN